MDVASKKRKAEDNGVETQSQVEGLSLSQEDVRKLLEPLTQEQLLNLLTAAVTTHPDLLPSARAVADSDVTRRKLFVRGIGPDTSTESLKSLFSSYGELDEAVVITDKATAKSKGYGFVTFRHVDGALLALRQPSKRIDGRMTVTHLASIGRGLSSEDQATRKIYVGNVPYDVSAERLLDYFLVFGDIEEGPLGFDKQGGKTRGFAFFVYKTEDGARAALVEPMKMIDGHQVMCKLAEDGKKGKVGVSMGNVPNSDNRIVGVQGGFSGLGMGSYPNYGPVVRDMGPGYNAPYSGGGSQYAGPGIGDFGSYRMPPPQSSVGAGNGMPPSVASGPYSQDGSAAGGYGPQYSSTGYMPPNTAPPQGPPQGPPGPMYPRMPPTYY